MKRIQGAVIGLMALTMAGAAFAVGTSGYGANANPGASSGSSANTNANANAASSTADMSNSWKSSELKGMKVKNRQNETLGSISDLIVDKDGKISNVVLREGGVAGVGGHQYLVPWDRIQLDRNNKFVILDVNKNQLSSEFSAMEENKSANQGKKGKKKSKKSKKSKTQTEGGAAGTSNGMSTGGAAPSGGASAPAGGGATGGGATR